MASAPDPPTRQVTYTAAGFINRNKDDLSDALAELLATQTAFEHLKPLVLDISQRRGSAIGAGAATATRRLKSRLTIAKDFGDSMNALMERVGLWSMLDPIASLRGQN
jgi:myosin heavy subunit